MIKIMSCKVKTKTMMRQRIRSDGSLRGLSCLLHIVWHVPHDKSYLAIRCLTRLGTEAHIQAGGGGHTANRCLRHDQTKFKGQCQGRSGATALSNQLTHK